MGGSSFIRDVWADNLEQEFETIREVIINYPFVSMDTEFPGVVARPIGNFKSSSDFHYQSVRVNVDILKIIQIGITLCNEEGELAPNVCTYQFNFKFSLNDDIYAQDSIDLLTRSGIDFEKHEESGIDTAHFAELLMCSGIVLCDEVRWITFHSGYDFAYIMKLLTCKPLPQEEEDFFSDLQHYCPHIFDIKHMMRSCENLKGGLTKLAEELEVERIGPEHQAGSDSLLTQATFFKMRSVFFEHGIDDEKFDNVLFGFGRGAHVKNTHEGAYVGSAPATEAY
mmetsp:Transcript_17678/g.37375  ORF Transcript_17678/g.37375 Transcript_17678/m.37375 type:complete len:282 (+) Transcript_17678:244-1089(+)